MKHILIVPCFLWRRRGGGNYWRLKGRKRLYRKEQEFVISRKYDGNANGKDETCVEPGQLNRINKSGTEGDAFIGTSPRTQGICFFLA